MKPLALNALPGLGEEPFGRPLFTPLPPVIALSPVKFCWKLKPLGEILPPVVLGFWYQLLLHGSFWDHSERGEVLAEGGTVESDRVGDDDCFCVESSLKPLPFVLWA